MQPAVSESGFFVGRADLKREALIGKKKLNGVIETSRYTPLRGHLVVEAISNSG